MALTEKDLADVKMARPVAVIDLWDIDDRIDRLEELADRLEAREDRLIAAIETLENLYRSERVKNWELILSEMLRKEEQKTRGHHNDNRTFGTKLKTADPERLV